MLSERPQMQGVQSFRNEAHEKYAAVTKDAAQRSRQGFCGSIKG